MQSYHLIYRKMSLGGGGKLKKNESITVYMGKKMSGRVINRVLLSKSWKIASVQRPPLLTQITSITGRWLRQEIKNAMTLQFDGKLPRMRK